MTTTTFFPRITAAILLRGVRGGNDSVTWNKGQAPLSTNSAAACATRQSFLEMLVVLHREPSAAPGPAAASEFADSTFARAQDSGGLSLTIRVFGPGGWRDRSCASRTPGASPPPAGS